MLRNRLLIFIAMLLITRLSDGDRCSEVLKTKERKGEEEEQHFKLSRAQVERPQRQVLRREEK